MRSRIASALYRHAAATPDKEAIWCDGTSLTYAEMAAMVSRYSRLLIHCGIGYGDHIAVPMSNSIASVALFFSAADLGVCLVPLNPSLPFAALRTAIPAADVRHLIARRAFLDECARQGGLGIGGVTICLDGEAAGAVPFSMAATMPDGRPDGPDIAGDESFILTMTSGSTGDPKPIDLSQDNKVARAEAHAAMYGLTADDRILAATPLYHSLAERLVLMPLMMGATSILLPRFTCRLWIDCVRTRRVTFTIAVSAQLAQLLTLLQQADEPAIRSLRTVVSSSALLDEEVKTALIDHLHCAFHEMYGTSETSTATNICFRQRPDKERSVGKPLPGVRLRILDDAGALCPAGTVGEIAVASPLICKGYYKRPEAMAQALTDGFFRTGDLGRLDDEGFLYFAGRKKELIITGAVNVYPADIDAVVGRMAGVRECAAFSMPDARLGETVGLAVVAEEGAALTPHAVRIYCARHLADFQQPHHIFFVEALPRNAMGKLQRMKIMDII